MVNNNTKYNSKKDTLEHIKRVNELLVDSSIELLERSKVHDDSKLKPPEKELFDEYTPKLRNTTYGSEEYKKNIQNLKKALDHHYKENSHHPEHYKQGVDGMDLFDLLEMLMDWKAATERHEDGDIYRSFKINKNSFKLSKQVINILKNTAKNLEWKK